MVASYGAGSRQEETPRVVEEGWRRVEKAVDWCIDLRLARFEFFEVYGIPIEKVRASSDDLLLTNEEVERLAAMPSPNTTAGVIRSRVSSIKATTGRGACCAVVSCQRDPEALEHLGEIKRLLA